VLLVTSQTEELGRHFTTDRAEMRRALVVPASQVEDITVVFATQSTILGAVFGKYGIRQIDGTWTAYLGGVRMARRDDTQTVYLEHARPSLIAVDLARDRTRMVEREAREGSWRSWLVDGRGEVAATLDIRTQTGDWVIAGPRGDRLASGNHPRGAVNLMG